MQPLQAQAVRSPENPHPLFALLAEVSQFGVHLEFFGDFLD